MFHQPLRSLCMLCKTHCIGSAYCCVPTHGSIVILTLFYRSGQPLVFVRLTQTRLARHLGGILSKARCCTDSWNTESHDLNAIDRQWLDFQGKGSSNEAAAAVNSDTAAQTQGMSAYQTQGIQSAGPGQGYSTGVAPGQGQGQFGAGQGQGQYVAGQGYGSGAAPEQGGMPKRYQ